MGCYRTNHTKEMGIFHTRVGAVPLPNSDMTVGPESTANRHTVHNIHHWHSCVAMGPPLVGTLASVQSGRVTHKSKKLAGLPVAKARTTGPNGYRRQCQV